MLVLDLFHIISYLSTLIRTACALLVIYPNKGNSLASVCLLICSKESSLPFRVLASFGRPCFFLNRGVALLPYLYGFAAC